MKFHLIGELLCYPNHNFHFVTAFFHSDPLSLTDEDFELPSTDKKPLMNGHHTNSNNNNKQHKGLKSTSNRSFHHQKPMPACKKKKVRKSSDEKFLEDNSNYYGFQVLESKLRNGVVQNNNQVWNNGNRNSNSSSRQARNTLQQCF